MKSRLELSRKQKDIVEFTIVFNQYKTKIYNYILRLVSNKMFCEDIVQNVFMKLFENLDSIRNKSSIKYWLFKTARNEVYTHFRNKKVRVDQFNVKDTDDLEINSNENFIELYEQEEMRKIIIDELNAFPPEQKEVYLLKEYGGFSYKEIAEMTDSNEDLVKSRLYKTRQKLIKRIPKKL